MKIRVICLLLLIIPLLAGCNEKSDYEKLVEKELDRKVRHNSLFLSYEFGMKRQEFYDHSWDLNRKGLVKQGPQNQTVEYELEDELTHSAKMNFYPDFHEEKIYQMRVRFKYDGWAPWNKSFSSDSLQIDVVHLFNDWYGDGFIIMEGSEDDPEYIKVDSNRRIIVGKYSDSEVIAVFTDLTAEKKLRNKTGNQ